MNSTTSSTHPDDLHADIQAFISYKRALGRGFLTEERTLSLLEHFFVTGGGTRAFQVTSEDIQAFLASRPRRSSRSYNHLLGVTREFFAWLVMEERLDRSPVTCPRRRGNDQLLPFIFDQSTIRRLLVMARALPDANSTTMRGTTYHAIFALLYGLGLRVGEVARLRVEDLEGERTLLFIRKSKFAKDRLVPFGPRLGALLRAYLEEKRRRFSGFASGHDPLFAFARNRMIHPGTISQTFLHLARKLQLEVPPGIRSPRAHDLRHSFAVGTLLRWYRSGTDPGSRLLALSTFLGHVDVSSTAVYLTMTSALLEEARRRFEAHAAPLVLQKGGEARP